MATMASPESPDWMSSLAEHYARCRAEHPQDHLLVVFDIDGTILDMRHMVSHVLNDFDRVHGTRLFEGLRPADVDVHENEIEKLLDRRGLGDDDRERVLAWYHARRWAPESVLIAHRPYRGVLEVIRWFQIQPRTSVALNTGRPEALRDATLRCLNALGREYKVSFTGELLHMNPDDWEVDVAAHKVAGLERFRSDGYRIVAAVDNEPEIIEAMAAADETQEILFLHAQTLYRSRRSSIPRTVAGRDYELRSLVGERDLPRHVQLVWHGVNDEANLRQFLASPVRWGELDVRCDPGGRLVLRHDAFEGLFGADSVGGADGLLTVRSALTELRRAGKAVKLDLKDADALDELLVLVAEAGLGDGDLWFNGRLDVLGEDGVRAIRAAHPDAIVQVPTDFLGPLVTAMPDEATGLLRTLTDWGVTRFSVAWTEAGGRELFEQLDRWGYEVNLYAVPDLEQFLRAALMLPRSITADFNFPEWHYFGRGSGQQGRYHRYTIDDAVPPAVDVA
jgi:mRNA-degrading endonuclease RelE of RelBE toxin-antitoxin system